MFSSTHGWRRALLAIAAIVVPWCGQAMAAMFGAVAIPDSLNPSAYPVAAFEGRTAVIVALSSGTNVVFYLPATGITVDAGKGLQGVAGRLAESRELAAFNLGGRTWFGDRQIMDGGVVLYNGYVVRNDVAYPIAFSLDQMIDPDNEVKRILSRVQILPRIEFSPAVSQIVNAMDQFALGNVEGLPEILGQIEAMDSATWAVPYLRGRLAEVEGNPAAAAAFFQTALSFFPGDIEITARGDGMRGLAGAITEGVSSLFRLATDNPEEPFAWEELGKIYLLAEDLAAAKEYSLQALAASPTSETALFALAYINARDGNAQDAYRRIREIRYYLPWASLEGLAADSGIDAAVKQQIDVEPLPLGLMAGYVAQARASLNSAVAVPQQPTPPVVYVTPPPVLVEPPPVYIEQPYYYEESQPTFNIFLNILFGRPHRPPHRPWRPGDRPYPPRPGDRPYPSRPGDRPYPSRPGDRPSRPGDRPPPPDWITPPRPGNRPTRPGDLTPAFRPGQGTAVPLPDDVLIPDIGTPTTPSTPTRPRPTPPTRPGNRPPSRPGDRPTPPGVVTPPRPGSRPTRPGDLTPAFRPEQGTAVPLPGDVLVPDIGTPPTPSTPTRPQPSRPGPTPPTRPGNRPQPSRPGNKPPARPSDRPTPPGATPVPEIGTPATPSTPVRPQPTRPGPTPPTRPQNADSAAREQQRAEQQAKQQQQREQQRAEQQAKQQQQREQQRAEQQAKQQQEREAKQREAQQQRDQQRAEQQAKQQQQREQQRAEQQAKQQQEREAKQREAQQQREQQRAEQQAKQQQQREQQRAEQQAKQQQQREQQRAEQQAEQQAKQQAKQQQQREQQRAEQQTNQQQQREQQRAEQRAKQMEQREQQRAQRQGK